MDNTLAKTEPERLSRRVILPLLAGVVIVSALILVALLTLGRSHMAASNMEDSFHYVDSAEGAGRSFVLRDELLEPVVAAGIEGILVEQATRESLKVAIIHKEGVEGEPPVSDIYSLEDGRQLTTDGLPKSALAISPDGTKIAYSYLGLGAVSDDPRMRAVQYVPDARLWASVLLDIATGEQERIGVGYGVQFPDPLNSRTVLYLSPEGIRVSSLARGESAVEVNVPISQTIPATGFLNAPRLSSDGTHMVLYDAAQRRFSVYAIDSLLPTPVLTRAGTISDHALSAAFSDTALYALVRADDGTLELRSYDPEAPDRSGRTVQTLGSAPSISRLLPQN